MALCSFRFDRESTLGKKSALKNSEELTENQLPALEVEIKRSIESTSDLSPNYESKISSSTLNNATSSLTLVNVDTQPDDKKTTKRALKRKQMSSLRECSCENSIHSFNPKSNGIFVLNLNAKLHKRVKERLL